VIPNKYAFPSEIDHQDFEAIASLDTMNYIIAVCMNVSEAELVAYQKKLENVSQ